MDKTLILFICGAALSIVTTMSIDLSEQREFFMQSYVDEGLELWKLIFLITMVTTVPFLAIDSLKNRFTRKNIMPFSFLAGSGTGFLIMGIVGIVVSLVR